MQTLFELVAAFVAGAVVSWLAMSVRIRRERAKLLEHLRTERLILDQAWAGFNDLGEYFGSKERMTLITAWNRRMGAWHRIQP